MARKLQLTDESQSVIHLGWKMRLLKMKIPLIPIRLTIVRRTRLHALQKPAIVTTYTHHFTWMSALQDKDIACITSKEDKACHVYDICHPSVEVGASLLYKSCELLHY
jgi:hypothetical protein